MMESKTLSERSLVYNIATSIYTKELDRYMLDMTISEIGKEIDSLSQPIYRYEPTYSYPKHLHKTISIVTLVACAVLGFLFGTFSEKWAGNSPVLLNILIPIPGIFGAVFAAIAGIFLLIPVNIISALVLRFLAKMKYEEAHKLYEQWLIEDKKLEQERLEKKTKLSENLTCLQSDLDKINDELKELYAESNIDESFCNPVSIAIMLKLLKLDICNSLNGPGGLYAVIKKDYKPLYDLTKLDEVNEKFQQISSESNHIAREMSFFTNDIQETYARSKELLTEIMDQL